MKTKDNSRNTLKKLPNDLPQHCIDLFVKINIYEPLESNNDGFEAPFKRSHPNFHPLRVIHSTVPSDDLNISPLDGYTFSICRSMQNVQLLSRYNEVLAYVFKYIGKIDEQNFVATKVNGDSGQLVNRYLTIQNFLYLKLMRIKLVKKIYIVKSHMVAQLVKMKWFMVC